MENLVKRTRSIYDGKDQKIASELLDINCNSCKSKIEVRLNSLKSMVKANSSKVKTMAQSISSVHTKQIGDTEFYQAHDLPLKFTEVSCGQCSTRFVLFYSFGEVQPARYILKLVGMFQEHPM